MNGPGASTRVARAVRWSASAAVDRSVPFHDAFVDLFTKGFGKLFRYLDRLSGDAELAQDLAQEAYVRLYRRQSLPDAPEAWLISVAMNLLRNSHSIEKRRRELMSVARADRSHADPARSPDQTAESEEIRVVVRQVLDRLPDRERQLLLLSAEGYSYRDIALALDLKEVSVGTLLARARQEFRKLYRSGSDDG